MAQKMLVGDKETVLLIPAFEINGVPQMCYPGAAPVPLNSPTAALLNAYMTTTVPSDTNAHWGGNVTCSIIDDMTLGSDDSATDDTRTLCSVGQSQDLTFYNYSAEMNFLMDEDRKDTSSNFNLPANLTGAPDLAYVIAYRIGYSAGEAASPGQEWHFFYVWTDHNIPTVADGSNQQLGQTWIPKGLLNMKAIIA